MLRNRSSRAAPSVLCLAISASVAATGMPAFAAVAPEGDAAATGAAAGETEAPAAAAVVALLRFTGESGGSWRDGISNALGEAGHTVRGVALDIDAAGKKAKCRGADEKCLVTLGKWLNKKKKKNAPGGDTQFIVWGEASGNAAAQTVTAHVFDVRNGKFLPDVVATATSEDYILPLMFPRGVLARVNGAIADAPPLSEAEKVALAELDEPKKTPEEEKAEQDAIAAATAAAGQLTSADLETKVEVDLRKDFKDFCRNEPRKKRESKTEDKDVRPSCKLGPTFGYFQPRGWVAMTLTIGTAVGAGVAYGLALGAKGPYDDANDALNAYNRRTGSDPRVDATAATNGGDNYVDLATEVSRTGRVMRNRARAGDVLLGATALFAGVFAIIVYQDRTDAKNYIESEKVQRAAVSDLRVGPMVGPDGQRGAAVGFRF